MPNAKTVFQTEKSKLPPRKKSILDEAIRTFAELGYRGADVQVIADRAGVGKGTVYRNFGTKEELFWATVAEVDVRLRTYIDEILKNQPRTTVDFLRTVAISYAEFYDKNRDCLEVNTLARSEFRGSIPKEHQEKYREDFTTVIKNLETGIQAGELKITDPEQASFAFIAMLDGVVTIHCYSDAMGWKETMVQQMQSAIDLFLHGLQGSPK